MRLLIGGSPCTRWSIAQKNNRETEPGGIGWELFENFLIAKEKFKPDYFLYENNKSMAKPIRNQIDIEFNRTYAENTNWELVSTAEEGKGNTKRWLWRNKTTGKTEYITRILINSALVSAQNRQRYYWTNIPNVPQPQDRGILLKDILDTGESWTQKSYALTTRCSGAIPKDTIERKRHTMVTESWDGKTHPVYEVKNGLITIKGKQYPIKLPDGYYIIRKLTVNECRRLQTIPDWYKMPCSASQNYKMLGNGWTVEVIKHILSYIPAIANCNVEVLSMYDGMSCGQITLNELGCKIDRYVSYEIDKYAIQTTQANFQNTEQRGDAFQVRKENWKY